MINSLKLHGGIMVTAILLIILVVLIYFALVLPRSVERPDTSYLLMRKYAHRGLHGEGVPENTLAAFSLAIENGYGIELDVRLTSDGVPVVFHDPTLSRMLGEDKKVSELTYEELKGYTFPGTEEKIPSFAEALELIAERAPILIELKGEDGDTSVCQAVADMLDGYNGVFAIQSFNPLHLRWMKLHRPQFIRGQLATNEYEKQNPILAFSLRHMLLNFLSRPDFASYYQHAHTLALDIFKSFGAPRFAWTLRNAEDEAKAAKRFETIIFENYRP